MDRQAEICVIAWIATCFRAPTHIKQMWVPYLQLREHPAQHPASMYPIVMYATPEPFSGKPTVTRTNMPDPMDMTVEGRRQVTDN